MSTKDIVYIALFASLTVALGLFPPLTLPVVGVPITAQSMGAMLAGAIIGAKRGGLALLLFCVFVSVGLPVMSGGRGGLSVFLSPSGGFILSWPIAAFVIGYLYEKNLAKLNTFKEAVFLIFGGIMVVYVIGIPWIALFANISIRQAAVGSIGFIPGDIIKIVLVILIAKTVRRAYPTLEPRS